jgi:hypothetical protein
MWAPAQHLLRTSDERDRAVAEREMLRARLVQKSKVIQEVIALLEGATNLVGGVPDEATTASGALQALARLKGMPL